MFVESEHIRNITIPFFKEKAIWICDDEYRNMMKAPESSVMNQLEKLMNIILNLKVDNLSEEEKLKVLSFTMLCNSELPEILENRKYFKFTCDKNKYKTTDENRLSILKKIRDSYIFCGKVRKLCYQRKSALTQANYKGLRDISKSHIPLS